MSEKESTPLNTPNLSGTNSTPKEERKSSKTNKLELKKSTEGKSGSKPKTPLNSSPLQQSLRGEISTVELLDDDGKDLLQSARDMVKEYLEKKQGIIKRADGQYTYRSHVVLILTVDDVPFATNLSIYAKSKNTDSKIQLHKLVFNGSELYTKPDSEPA